MATNGGISRNQERAIVALLQSRSVAEAAKQANVGTRTLERWLAEDDVFVTEYRSARVRAFEEAEARLAGAAVEAVECLKRNLSKPAPPSTQVKAALGILELASAGIEQFAVIERLDALERQRSVSSNGYRW